MFLTVVMINAVRVVNSNSIKMNRISCCVDCFFDEFLNFLCNEVNLLTRIARTVLQCTCNCNDYFSDVILG